LISPSGILVRFEHVVLVLRDFRECDRYGLAAVLESCDLVLRRHVLRHILLDLAVHLFISLLAMYPHIAAANEDAHDEDTATATGCCINDPRGEQRFLAIVESG
jgi:hypothetical protein